MPSSASPPCFYVLTTHRRVAKFGTTDGIARQVSWPVLIAAQRCVPNCIGRDSRHACHLPMLCMVSGIIIKVIVFTLAESHQRVELHRLVCERRMQSCRSARNSDFEDLALDRKRDDSLFSLAHCSQDRELAASTTHSFIAGYSLCKLLYCH